jgi:hypothetical protein
MTWKDLQRVIESQPSSNQNQQQLQKLKGKPFWNWASYDHRKEHTKYKGQDCFNHIISPCKKDGVEKTFFDYEYLIYRALFEPGYFNSRPRLRLLAESSRLD